MQPPGKVEAVNITEKLRIILAIDCGDRETLDWAASTGGNLSLRGG